MGRGRFAGPLLGTFAMGIDTVAASIALPAIQADLDVPTSTLQWTAGVYMATIAATVIAIARLGDQLGRRRVFLVGLVLFGAGSLACALAGGATVLILSRLVQGLGGAALYALPLALITAESPRERVGQAVALWATVAGLAMAVAPLVAGALVSLLDWRAVFAVNLPVVVASYVLTRRLLGESRDEAASRRIDVPGVVSLTAGLAMLMVGLIQANAWGWGSPAVLALLAGSVLPLAAFAVVELRSPDPLIDLRLFGLNRLFLAANVLAVAAYGAVYAFLFVVALFLQEVQGLGALEAGLRLLPFPVAFFLVSRYAGRAVTRLGSVPVMVGGAVVTSTGLVWLSFADAGPDGLVLAGSFTVLGAGQALLLIAISAAALGSVPAGKAGAASGIRSTAAYVGGALYVAAVGSLLTVLERRELADASAEAGRRLTAAELADVDGVLAGAPGALRRARELPPLSGDQVVTAATDAFTYAMSWSMRLVAAILLVTAAGVLLAVRRPGRAAPAPGPEPSPLHPPPPAAQPKRETSRSAILSAERPSP